MNSGGVFTVIDKLNRKLRGHYNYYGVIGNSEAMRGFREYVLDRLKASLNRRGANKDMTEGVFRKLIKVYPVALPRIVHRIWLMLL